MAATAHLNLVAPDNEKFTVQSAPARLPRRKPNAEYRSREHLTEREVERLIEAMKGNRWGHRDATMVLIAFRHGLRAAELLDLRWDQIDLEHALLHVRRLKNGSPATHPLTGKELRALRRLNKSMSGGKLLANNSTVKFCLPRPASAASVILHAATTRYSPGRYDRCASSRVASAGLGDCS